MRMTEKEFFEKYGERKVKLISYHKYTFTFTDGKGFAAYIGGDSDSIYRLEVEADREYTVEELDLDSASMYGVKIYEA